MGLWSSPLVSTLDHYQPSIIESRVDIAGDNQIFYPQCFVVAASDSLSGDNLKAEKMNIVGGHVARMYKQMFWILGNVRGLCQ